MPPGAAKNAGSGDLREDAKRRLADRELEELGIPAAELVRPALVAALDLDLAHRQRLPLRLHRAKADAPALRGLQEVEVDLDLEDLLHAPHVGVPELLVCVDERTRAGETGGRVDDLVAVDVAVAALDLVLRPAGQ